LFPLCLGGRAHRAVNNSYAHGFSTAQQRVMPTRSIKIIGGKVALAAAVRNMVQAAVGSCDYRSAA
jgi:hypothetical protein